MYLELRLAISLSYSSAKIITSVSARPPGLSFLSHTAVLCIDIYLAVNECKFPCYFLSIHLVPSSSLSTRIGNKDLFSMSASRRTVQNVNKIKTIAIFCITMTTSNISDKMLSFIITFQAFISGQSCFSVQGD